MSFGSLNFLKYALLTAKKELLRNFVCRSPTVRLYKLVGDEQMEFLLENRSITASMVAMS